MSKPQLNHANYRTDKASLPAPVGCYRNTSGKLLMLYDPAQCRKKSSRKPIRVTMCLSDILWPIDWLPLIEAAIHSRDDQSYRRHQTDMLLMAFQLLSFSADEIEQVAGPCVRFAIQPIVLHRLHSTFMSSLQEQHMLRVQLLRGYSNLKAAS